MAKSLSEKLADLANPEPEDNDPENINNDEGSESSGDEAEQARAHYIDVGRSRLRHDDLDLENEKYKGQRVSRENMNDHEASNSDSDSSSSDPSGLDLGARPNNFESEIQESSNDDESDSLTSMSDQQGIEDDSDSSDGEQSSKEGNQGTQISEVKRILESENANMASRLKENQAADVSKGCAVQAQMAIWEELLDIRITVQKILSVTNTDVESSNEAIEALKNLIYEMQSLRERLTGNKEALPRKHRLDELDDLTKTLDSDLRSNRDSILTKWSRKVQLSSGQRVLQHQFKSLNQSATQQVHTVLTDMERLVGRTYINRSSFHINGEVPAESTDIFDDTDFYRLLLRDLVERRMADPNVAQGINFKVDKSHSKRKVDTKASKGRKLRYHVQEKIQGFDAPRNVFNWTDEQAEDLFSNLFGRGITMDDAEFVEDEQKAEPVVDKDFALFA